MDLHNKYKRIRKYILLTLMLICVCMLEDVYVPRADINGAESQVIGAAGSTFYYDGAYYRAKDTYINQLINALDTQYDLSQSQANACIDYIYNNVGAAISSGYMYKVPDETDTAGSDSTEGTSGENAKEQGGENGSGTNIADEKNQKQTTGTAQVVQVDKETTEKTKEEALKEATELASDMGLIVKFDNGKEGITITDQSGNVLISTREAVKNTGFRLNSLIIYVVLIVLAILAMCVLVFKLKLLERDYGEEDAETD